MRQLQEAMSELQRLCRKLHRYNTGCRLCSSTWRQCVTWGSRWATCRLGHLSCRNPTPYPRTQCERRSARCSSARAAYRRGRPVAGAADARAGGERHEGVGAVVESMLAVKAHSSSYSTSTRRCSVPTPTTVERRRRGPVYGTEGVTCLTREGHRCVSKSGAETHP